MNLRFGPISSLFETIATFLLLIQAWSNYGSSGGVVNAFTVLPNINRWTAAVRVAEPTVCGAGRGMGMAPPTKGKNKNKKNKASKKGAATAAGTKSPFDAGASLLKMEKRYDSLVVNSAKAMQKDDQGHVLTDKDLIAKEYMIAARVASKSASAASSSSSSLTDWVPVAQLVMGRPLHHLENAERAVDEVTEAAISFYCREIAHAAGLGCPVFKSVARNDIEYSLETLDSFHKHVYDYVRGAEANSDDKDDESMTKSQARKLLGLDEGPLDRAELKRIYRQLSFKLHPDRFVGEDRTEEEKDATNEEYARVKLAYETLSSGIVGDAGVSWYGSLGGKSRKDFSGTIGLIPLNKAKTVLDSVVCDSAIVGLDPDLVQSFVTRNIANSK